MALGPHLGPQRLKGTEPSLGKCSCNPSRSRAHAPPSTLHPSCGARPGRCVCLSPFDKLEEKALKKPDGLFQVCTVGSQYSQAFWLRIRARQHLAWPRLRVSSAGVWPVQAQSSLLPTGPAAS